jgi:hypothetical protein
MALSNSEICKRYRESHREAVAARLKSWYTRNTHRYTKYAKDARVRNREFLNEYKRNHPCIDCGENDIVVLDFDHRVGVKKLFTIGEKAGTTTSIEKLQAEIDKCDVRCANCHRRRTHALRQLR